MAELKDLAVDIERCKKSIDSVMEELNSANAQFPAGRTTRQEIEYLTILLSCAKRKLVWEKQIASLKKRAPALLEGMSAIMNDRDHPPSDEFKAAMLGVLQTVQQAMERLRQVEISE